jgi:Uma2 family endonuclease
MASTTHLTVDDFEKLPSELTKNHELVDGELIPMSGNTLMHILIRDVLARWLAAFVEERQLGWVVTEMEYDFDGNVHAPDISFFGAAKKVLADLHKRVQKFVPDLAIEVVSENDTYSSLKRKKERYLASGTQEVWIVSPEDRQVEIHTQHCVRVLRGEEELATDLIPGFRISVRRLFDLAWE